MLQSQTQLVITGWTIFLSISHYTNTSMYFCILQKENITLKKFSYRSRVMLGSHNTCHSVQAWSLYKIIAQGTVGERPLKELYKHIVLIDELHKSWPASHISPTCMDCMFWISSLSEDIWPAGEKGTVSVPVEVFHVTIWSWSCSKASKLLAVQTHSLRSIKLVANIGVSRH
jgi:hypothetical protein